MDKNLSLLEPLLDFSFRDFITIRFIRILYIIAIILAAISALGFVAMGFSSGVFPGLLTLILSPLVFLLSVLMARIYLEVVIVLFRIAENTQRIAEAAEESIRHS